MGEPNFTNTLLMVNVNHKLGFALVYYGLLMPLNKHSKESMNEGHYGAKL